MQLSSKYTLLQYYTIFILRKITRYSTSKQTGRFGAPCNMDFGKDFLKLIFYHTKYGKYGSR